MAIKEDVLKAIETRSSTPHGDASFNNKALVSELKGILEIFKVDPGFRYIDACNSYAVNQNFVRVRRGTELIEKKGTVFIGTKLVRELLEKKDGVAVAGIMAHECAHIFQYSTHYFTKLATQTRTLLELHADVLAGYYLGRKKSVEWKHLSGFQIMLIQSGTYSPDGSHGTSGQRVSAIEKGFKLSMAGKTFEDAAREGADYVQTL